MSTTRRESIRFKVLFTLLSEFVSAIDAVNDTRDFDSDPVVEPAEFRRRRDRARAAGNAFWDEWGRMRREVPIDSARLIDGWLKKLALNRDWTNTNAWRQADRASLKVVDELMRVEQCVPAEKATRAAGGDGHEGRTNSLGVVGVTADKARPQKAPARRRVKIKLSKDRMSLSLVGELVRLKSRADGDFVAALLERRGESITGKSLEAAAGSRPDRIYKRLPKRVQDCISKPNRGQRGYMWHC